MLLRKPHLVEKMAKKSGLSKAACKKALQDTLDALNDLLCDCDACISFCCPN